MKRPTSVSVIAWFLIACAFISAVGSYFSRDNPLVLDVMAKNLLPISVQYVMMYAGLVVTVATAVAMLKGLNWGRVVYFAWSAFGLVVGLATSPIKMALVPGTILLVIFAFFLYRPKANAYFFAATAANDA